MIPQLQAELFPPRRPRGIRVWALYPNGVRVKLYERRGLRKLLRLGTLWMDAVRFSQPTRAKAGPAPGSPAKGLLARPAPRRRKILAAGEVQVIREAGRTRLAQQKPSRP